VSSVRSSIRGNRKLAVESAALGLGYTAVLIWGGTALVGTFSAGEAGPYWPVIPHLRTDTTGAIAFAVAIVSLVVYKYLELSRRNGAPAQPAAQSAAPSATRPTGVLALQAMAETGVVLGTGLVIYLSLNAVTHPVTLGIQLTHLWPWPSEGTVRVIGLGICLVSVAIRRYLRATANGPGQAAPESEAANVNALRSPADAQDNRMTAGSA
jgi:energy-converting hydrogenase Eha subunit A